MSDWSLPRPPAAPGQPVPVPLPLNRPVGPASGATSGDGKGGFLKRFRPTRKQLLIGAAVLVAVAIPAVLAFVLMSEAPAEEQVGYAFDSEVISQITDGMTTSEFPQSTIESPDEVAAPPWNYGVSPGGGSTSTPGSGSGSKYSPYTSGGGSSYSGGGGGGGSYNPPTQETDDDDTPVAVVPPQMPAGAYTFGASGSWTESLGQSPKTLPATVNATVAGSGDCSILTAAGGKVGAGFQACAENGALVGRARTRNGAGIAFKLDCAGPLVPAGATNGQSTNVSCTLLPGVPPLTGSSKVSDGGSSWTVVTSVAGSGSSWSETVTIEKVTGRITRLQTKADLLGSIYREDSVFTLQ